MLEVPIGKGSPLFKIPTRAVDSILCGFETCIAMRLRRIMNANKIRAGCMGHILRFIVGGDAVRRAE